MASSVAIFFCGGRRPRGRLVHHQHETYDSRVESTEMLTCARGVPILRLCASHLEHLGSSHKRNLAVTQSRSYGTYELDRERH